MRTRVGVGVLVSTIGFVGACSSTPAEDSSPSAKADFALTLSASTVSDLPPCTPALAGTSAYVAMPPAIYSCVKSKWVENKCTDALAGAVAYASASNLLLACVSGHWTPIALPPGDAGSGLCTASALQCNGEQPQQCGSNGDWLDIGPSCATLNQACTAGACVGVCTPASTDCVGSNVRTCQANGEWSTAACTTPVANAVATCTAGACSGFACVAGFTQCGASSCFNLQNDPSNCGSCGHSCGAASCVSGACASTTLATSGSIGGIAVDAANVYYTVSTQNGSGTDGLVRSVPIGGGAPVTLASGLAFPVSIAVDATTVYWANQTANGGFTGSVQSEPIGGGTITTLASGLNYPAGVSVEHTVFFNLKGLVPIEEVLFTNGDASFNRMIEGLSPTGGAAITLYTTPKGHPNYTAADTFNVYFTDYNLGTVNKTGSFGGDSTVLASGQNGPSVIAVDAANVYWIDDNRPLYPLNPPGAGAVMKVAVGGGPAITLATVTSGELGPTGMAIDGTNVYYATYHGPATGPFAGTLWEVPLTGGTPIPIAHGGMTGAVAAFGANVYWVAGGALLKSIK